VGSLSGQDAVGAGGVGGGERGIGGEGVGRAGGTMGRGGGLDDSEGGGGRRGGDVVGGAGGNVDGFRRAIAESGRLKAPAEVVSSAGQNQKAASVACLRWANAGKMRIAARRAMTAATFGGKRRNCLLMSALSYATAPPRF
jgi:hypothetical protein